MSRKYGEGELLRRSVESRLLDVRTSMAAEIVSYDASKNLAVVRPGVRVQVVDPDSDPEVQELADLQGVPVLFPTFGDSVIYFPIGSGTVGRLEFSEEDDSLFYLRSGSGPVDPLILERHKASAVFRPEGSRGGGFRGSEPAGRGFVGMPGGIGISFGSDDLRLGGSDAGDPVIRRSDLDALFGSAWTPAPNDGGAALKTVWTGLATTIGSSEVKAK